MQDNIDLAVITDITELKALKSDQYDMIANANNQLQVSQQNIANINARIVEIEKVEPAPTNKK